MKGKKLYYNVGVTLLIFQVRPNFTLCSWRPTTSLRTAAFENRKNRTIHSYREHGSLLSYFAAKSNQNLGKPSTTTLPKQEPITLGVVNCEPVLHPLALYPEPSRNR